jgi:tetratricopeptide (TPR) repeat protein
MRPDSFRTFIPIVLLMLEVSFALPCWAEHGFVLVLVQDAQHHPVRGVEVGIEGNGGSKTTGDDGKAQLPVGASTKEGDWLSMVILHSPPGKDLVIISPWDNRSVVPSFEDKPENFIRVVTVQRGDRAALESGSVLAFLAEKINKANSPKSANDSASLQDPRENLAATAKQYGLAPDEVDQAIRAWAAKTTDPYEAGLAALYERDFSNASAQLQNSLKQREEKLTTDQKTLEQDRKQVADAAFFLGQSLYQQGKYRESAEAYERCLQIRPDDPLVLNNTAMSLSQSGNYAKAEPLFRRAIAINENLLGRDHPDVAASLNNLAELLEHKGDSAGAESLLREALEIDREMCGPECPRVATNLANLGKLLQEKGEYVEAEQNLRKALEIDEKALGSDNPQEGICLNELARLYQAKGEYARADPLYRKAISIARKALGPDHPEVALTLNNLAVMLRNEGDLAQAEALYWEALRINEKALGPDHPEVGRVLSNLAVLLDQKGDRPEAEAKFRRALAIREKSLGPDHPDVANTLDNLAGLLEAKGDYAEAEAKIRRALGIYEKAWGPDHPQVAVCLNNLAHLLTGECDYADAERQYRRALEIDTKALGPDHPSTRKIRANLNAVLEAEKQMGK